MLSDILFDTPNSNSNSEKCETHGIENEENENKEKRSFVTFGRCPDVDFVVTHPTVSRLHGIFQFSQDGRLFLFDNSQGRTKLNHKTVAYREFVEMRNARFSLFFLFFL